MGDADRAEFGDVDEADFFGTGSEGAVSGAGGGRRYAWRVSGPFGVGLEGLPVELLEEFFAEGDLGGAGEVHGVVPGDDAVAGAARGVVGRGAMGLSAAVDLPDAVGAVGVAGGAVGHA